MRSVDRVLEPRRQLLRGSAGVLTIAGVTALLGSQGGALAQKRNANAGQDVGLLNAAIALEHEGITGAITGRAIYEGKLDFAKAQKLADELSKKKEG